ncbi:MAG: coproporphyrinogen III oxidase [Alphaproteobacteria bacterium]|nr:coproporphyrinogen III oxidase [Alphaproteobacteria bacterium]
MPTASEKEREEAGLALYVHWPFCLSKCPYCDFNSHVREGVAPERWERALLAALDRAAADTPGRQLTSLFFGGGTPSLMAPLTVARLIERAKAHWPAGEDPEITLEANPTSVEAGRFKAFAEAGVNRLSLGIQALRDPALRFLGREHSVREALAALDIAKAAFGRVSFDLIYARPDQTPADWRTELEEALALAGGHFSVYQLTIEPGTAFFQQHRAGALATPDATTGARLYETTQAVAEAAGFSAYEISNHAKPGEECRHNLAYWRGEEYIGIGPGAHGRVGGRTPPEARRSRQEIRLPERWLAAIERQGHAIEAEAILTPEDRLAEFTMMALRLRDGMTRTGLRRKLGLEIETAFPTGVLSALIVGDFLVLDDRGLRMTAKGRLRLDAILPRLLGD